MNPIFVILADAAGTAPADKHWLDYLSAFSTALTAVVVAGGVVYAYWQMKAARAGVMVQAWIEAERIFCEDPFAKLRGKLYAIGRTVDGEEWKKAGTTGISGVSYDEAKDACRKLNLCAALAERGGAMDAEYFNDNWADPFRKSWIVLKGVVRYEEKDLERPKVWNSFERAGRAGLTHLGWPPKKKGWIEPPNWRNDSDFAAKVWRNK